MGYRETVAAKINSTEARLSERQALWKTIADSFELEGATGVENELKERASKIERESSAAVAELERML